MKSQNCYGNVSYIPVVGIYDDTDEHVKALTDAANQQDELQGAIFNQTLAKMYALNFSPLDSPDYSQIPSLFWLVSSW